MMELENHDSAWFVTLTYRPEDDPIACDPETGEALDWLTLRKRDLQLFFKRLRKAYPSDHIRYFAAGEYGDQTFRPHYHCIIYGLHLDDLEVYKKSPLGFTYWNSPKLEKVWSYGFAVVAEVTWESCAYTARYCMKKRNGKDSRYYTDMCIEPEFVVMSRKPGIARDFYETHLDIYDHKFINLATDKGGIKFVPPRYFDKLFELENPQRLEEIKLQRQKVGTATQESKLRQTSLSRDELLEVEERSFERKIKALRRSLE